MFLRLVTLLLFVIAPLVLRAQSTATNAEALGKQLAAAANDADRDRLLAAHPELPYSEVRPPFVREIFRLFGEGKYPEVVTLCHYLEAASTRFNDPRGVVLAYMSLANVSNQRGDYDEAAAGYARALELATGINYPIGKLSAANGIGILEQRRGDYVAALEHEQLALQYATDLNNPDQIADALLNLATAAYESGDTRQSLAYYHRVQELKGSDPAYAAYLLNGLGVVYQSQGDASAALSYFQRASQASESQHLEREAITALNNIGEAQRALGQYAESAATFQEVLSRAERLQSKKAIGLAWVNLGLTYNAQGRPVQAWDACRDGFTKLEAIGDRPGMSDALTCESEAAFARKDLPAAQETAARSAAIGEEINDIGRQWKPLTLSGRAHQAAREWHAATTDYDRAITAIETMRDRVVGDERQRQRFFQDKVDPYYAMVDLLVQQGQPEKAFRYAERARARVLQDVFGGSNSQAAPSRLMTTEERTRETQLNRTLANWSRQLYQETIADKPSAPRIATLKHRLESARIDAESFRTALFLSHPELKALRGDSTAVTRQELEPLLAKGQRALLEFVVLDRLAYLFVSTQGRFRVYRLAISRHDIASEIETLRTSIANRGQAFRPVAAKLFQQLLQPAAEQLRAVTALCIVPDGELWELPFQTLIQPTGKYAIEDYAISYAPSLTVLRDMRRHPRSALSNGTSIALLAVGNPDVVSGRKSSDGPVSRSAPAALPDAENEVRRIGELFRSSHTEILTGDQANEDRFKRIAGQARILHLATHGILNNANPLYSSLLLSTSSKTATQEDGLLEAWEIMQMNLHSELAVLSACETGRGRVRPGEGMIGLSWAFFVAGVPRTVVSQWKVESSSTAELMIDFYRRHLKGDSPAQAMQGAAKRLLLENGQFRHPFFWAPFIVVGNLD